MKRIPVGDTFALVDDQDYDRLMVMCPWHLVRGYAQRTIKTSDQTFNIRMHRAVLNLEQGDPEVDHINHDPLDNRRENLRTCTRQQNNRHARAQSIHAGHSKSSQFKGVCLRRTGNHWRAYITISRRRIHLGSFDNEAKAARAYDSAAAHFFGKFAVLNFPNEVPVAYPPPKGRRVTSSYRGVCYHHSNGSPKKWLACLTACGSRVYLGYHLTESEAIAACETYLQEHGLPSRLPL